MGAETAHQTSRVSNVNMVLPSHFPVQYDRLRMRLCHPAAFHHVWIGGGRHFHHVVVVRAMPPITAVDSDFAVLGFVGPVEGLTHADEVVDVLAAAHRDIPRHQQNDPAVRENFLDDHRDAHFAAASHDDRALPHAGEDAQAGGHIDRRYDVVGDPPIAQTASFRRGGTFPL